MVEPSRGNTALRDYGGPDCLRSVKSDFLGNGIPGLIAVLVVAAGYKWKHSTFISIVAGTAVYMVLIRII